MDEKIGGYMFILGTAIAVFAAIVVALMPGQAWMAYVPFVLFIIGLLVGLLNIGDKEVTPFLIAAIALMITANASSSFITIDKVLSPIGTILMQIVLYLAVFAAPAALVIALLEFWKIAGTTKGRSK